MSEQAKPTIVFAHGLWADGSCYSKVIPRLLADGFQVISTQNHLNTVADDAAAASKRCIVRMTPLGIEAGFIEPMDASWLPDGVNNVLYINDERAAYGPGAGAEATVGAMLTDIEQLL